MKNTKYLIYPILLIGLSYLILNLLRIDPNTATCMPDNCFCEKMLPEVIKHPANTWSNLTLIAAGIAIVIYGIKDTKRKTKIKPIYSIAFGLVVTIAGLSSFYYHATYTFIGQWLDNLSIGTILLMLGFYNMLRIFPSTKQYLLESLLFSVLIYGYLNLFIDIFRRHIFVVLYLILFISEIYLILKGKTKRILNYFIISNVFIFLGYFVWILDNLKIVCYPESLFQLHSVWHLLASLAVFFIYLYARSDKKRQ